ncbi:MAG: APC family permease [Dermatophilus congolensis]|nr:APC family permease [Dermatophilus congolensis]
MNDSAVTAQGRAVEGKKLHLWGVAAMSLAFMAPVMAMSLNGIGVAGLVGKGVAFTFAVSFVGTLLVAYAFIRLTRYFTHAGSVYALAGSTLGSKAGFFGGFALLGTYLFFAVCIAGATGVFFDAMLIEFGSGLSGQIWVVVPLVVSAIIALLTLRESLFMTNVLLGIGFVGIVAMLGLAAVILTKVGSGSAPVTTGIDLSTLTPDGVAWTAVPTAAVFGFLSWAGFESGTTLAEETENPTRVIPRALLAAVILAGFLYTFMMFAQSIGFGTDEAGIAAFAEASSTLTTLSSTYIGPWFAVMIAIIAFAVAIGSLTSSTGAAARLLYALARDGFGPAAFGRTNAAGVPTAATVFVIGFTTVFAVGFGLAGATAVDVYYWFATVATLCMVVAYGMTSIGALRFALRPGSPLKAWEAIIPLAGLAFLVLVYAIQVIGQEAPYTWFPWIAGAWCLVGLVIVLTNPALANRIGSRLATEDLE